MGDSGGLSGGSSVDTIVRKSNSEIVLSEIPDESRSTSQYQIKPSLKEGFQGHAIKEIISNVLVDVLDGKQYSSNQIQEWTSKISDTISMQVKELNMRRYKHIVQVVIVQQTGAGCRYIARCKWDAECDAQVSHFLTNESLTCIATVFGIYIY